MEKKGNHRSLIATSKGVSSDSNKKNQDGVGTKLWPRNGRRREPNSGTLSTKCEPQTRKLAPLRFNNKTFGKKQPQPRRSPISDVASTETARLDDDDEIQLGSVFLPGSKKQSLNHLLNFTYESYVPESGRRPPTTRNSNNNKLFYSKKHKYNKEHFLQANCQFIVNASGEYKQYLNNPDALVDWDLIEQVNVHVTEFPSCPICLYPPMAAQITKCGHIYCWSCILHYLALSDQQWRKCPICYDAIQKKDLKSVVNIPHNLYNVNDLITFKLMKRRKGSLIAYPAQAVIKEGDVIFNLSDKEAEETFAKLLIANQNEIMSIIHREHNELQEQKNKEEGPEICFIDEALSRLDQRKSVVLASECKELQRKMESRICSASVDNDPNFISETNNEQSTPEIDEFPNVETLNITSSTSKNEKFHYFYQATDGQHIYLQSINAKMVEYQYGSLESGPLTLQGKILEKEGGSMDEEQRKRLRYLQHLPLTCQFEVAEIQLQEPLVTKETLEYFHEQLDIRKKRRQRRAKEEKKREKRIASVENRIMGKPNTTLLKNLHIDSESQFPCFSQSVEDSSNISTPNGSWGREQEVASYSGPSFAKIIATASTKKSLPSTPITVKSDPPVKLINVTGAKIKCNFSQLRHHSDSESDVDSFEPIPHVSSLADAIEQALQKKTTAVTTEFENVESCNNGRKNKKKKNKPKQVLFVNSMSHGK